MLILLKNSRNFLLMAFSSFVLMLAGLHDVSAETPGQPEIKTVATNSVPASAETNTRRNPSSPDAPRTQTTGSGTGATGTNALPGQPPDMSLTPPVHVTGQEPEKTPSIPAEPQKPKTVQAPLPKKQAQPRERLGPQVDPCHTVSVAGDNWMDQVHGFVQDNTCEPAVWFDTFFVKDHLLLALRPGTYIVLRNSARLAERQGVSFLTDYSVRYRLPQMEKMLKKAEIFITSGAPADRFTKQPGQPVDPGIDPATGERKPVVGVRLDFYSWLRSLVSIESGIKVNIHPDAFIRMRYQYEKPFSEVCVVRFSEIAMWQTIEHFTNTTQFDLERKLSTFSLVRWGNSVTYTEGSNGVAWNTGLSLLTQLTPKSAISYDTNVWGVTYPTWITQNYRVGIKYRRNFYRTWLFYELEPEVTWPKDVNGLKDATGAFMVTLEMQFGK